ncbi:hypothetical protein ACWGJQ_25930 [Peribacillus simplex]
MIKELIENFKSGDSTQKLGIISDLISIITAVVTLITAQAFAVKFVITETTIIKTAFYILAMSISLFVIFFYLKGISFIRKEYKSLLVQSAFILCFTSFFIFITYTVWSFFLSFE